MPQDSIMMWVNNEESFYNQMMALYDQWLEEGDAWDEAEAEKEAHNMIAQVAETIESFEFTEGRYSDAEIREAVTELMDEYGDYREAEIEERMREAVRKPTPEDLEMTPSEVEHAEKYEKIAKEIGIEQLKELIPVSPAKIRTALERGDKHLNSIPLRKWDAAADQITGPRRTLAERVSALKHVARWHYA